MSISINASGTCVYNPGPGGWAILIQDGSSSRLLSEYDIHTTQNSTEITAVLMALRHYTQPTHLTIVTDSYYVCSGVTRWMDGWKSNNWLTTSKNQPVKNGELWKELDELCKFHTITWQWLPLHSNDEKQKQVDNESTKQALVAKELAPKRIRKPLG